MTTSKPTFARFFSLEGVDGAGKSTQLALFERWLVENGHNVVTCRDPGSTRLGEAIREIVLAGSAGPACRRAEMLLYMAARAQLVEEVVSPALAAGKTVLSDRFLLANVVYQGHAGGLPVDAIWSVGDVATSGIAPDLSIVLDLSPEAALARVNRPLDRMERQGREFRRLLREGYLAEAKRRPERIVVIDASGSIDEVQVAIQQAARRVL